VMSYAYANTQAEAHTPFVHKLSISDTVVTTAARARSTELITQLIKAQPKANEDLIFFYWALEHVYDNDEITSHWSSDGYWIKFYEDFTYQTGINGDIVSLGTYYYDVGDLSLLLVDADTERFPQLWRLGLEGIDASLIGRPYFEIPNGVQIKLTGVHQRPKGE